MRLAVFLALALPAGLPAADEAAARQASVRLVSDQRYGSGAVVGQRDGFYYVLTASHVVAGATGLKVHTYPADAGGQLGPVLDGAVVVFEVKDADLAVVRVPAGAAKITPLAIAPPGTKVGESFAALTVGFTPNGPPDCRADRVVGKRLLRRPDGTGTFAWETESRPDHGRSGGPLLDPAGRLVGVCRGTQNGKGYYAHLDEIYRALKDRKLDWLWQAGAK